MTFFVEKNDFFSNFYNLIENIYGAGRGGSVG
ncbi:hypothetical protein CLV98_101658 [Dyadobacter jejuensis]|uniref:Uncharacterized protein n=1 Tax=Dyadobacter jejuensis TaxID=1082580 RepID=A0A316AT70_9BACT|nr:hypothetical protein CLV98_101658 [Dyadobacter jejuensis]